MLQDIRKSTQGTAAKVVIGLIVLSFALFGIESILVGGGGSSVAEVNGETVSPIELQQAVDTQRRQLMAMMGDDLDPALLDEQRLSARALEGIINRKLLMQSARSMGLTVSEAELGAVIGGMEQFQVDGEFSPEMYKSLLASAGYTPGTFKRALKDDLVLNQLRAGLAGSDFATSAELALNARILAEQRDIRYLTIPLEPFLAESAPDAAEIEAWYRANEERFMTPESVVLNYVELTLEDFRKPVAERDIEEEYRIQVDGYQYQTENRVAHILLQQGSDESAADFANRIDAVQAALAAGEEFAAVAAERSDDIGSASNGGDLGFSAGDAFPEEMEAAIAELDVNVISEPVETEAGTHILLVTERREADPPSLAELRPELESRLQDREARVALLLAVEQLRDLAFTAGDLSRPAEELGLEVKRSEPVTRDQQSGPLAAPGILRAAFSEDVLELGHNSEVVELGGDRFVAVHLHRHNKPELQPLAAVQEEIVAALTRERAQEALERTAEAAVESLAAGEESLEALAVREGYEWQVELGARRDSRTVPGPVLQRAFSMPAPASGPVADYVVEASGDARVLELVRVEAGELATLPPEQQRSLRQRIGSEFGAMLQVEHEQALRSDADISVL
ncbi:SurA N-terminal domain-containing protein [Haliea sp. E1-2-M8]|uniref:SurA N-terminal domain-containing protein n=1 Tax=Haliea sp. E1-2-M8 TaxID=3064706 RepID=UPI0027227951|nr:SurA N-terminal domain-containing protein [Haliea sp. E1-2-M8]MDO8862337.1 SurA N-terminal domain-containing protein [Haliea sp. E1-2-M8]